MPNLNVITWNSADESEQGAADMKNAIASRTTDGWQPSSGSYSPLVTPHANNIGLIAGDLNVASVSQYTGNPIMPYILPGFTGVSNKVAHVLGHPHPGGSKPTLSNQRHFPTSGPHEILVCTVSF